ncbi:MAG TPA: fatty acid CoA ligase family protein [Lacunisphaera sp.]
MPESANIARHLPSMAARQPERVAIKIPRRRTAEGKIDYLTLSFAELDGEVDAWAARLKSKGVQRGDRVLVMVRQGLSLVAAAFALFKIGAVPVIIDPGMGRKNFLACIARSKPRVLLGIPFAQVMSRLFPFAFASVQVRVWTSSSATARVGGKSADAKVKSEIVASAAGDLAAILFTSGSTGAPKGVCYEHGMFEAQVRLVRDTYGISSDEVDLPMLPIFALFNPALGMTTVVPELDPSRPAAVDPEKIVRAIQQENVTTSFGSPTLWRKIFDYCLENEITLPSMRRVLCAGAAVPASLWTDAPRVLTNGKLHSPYGATEVLPVATTSSAEMENRPELGALIGRPLAENRVKIIALHEGRLATMAETHELPAGEVGEIIVTGPTVTKVYDQLPSATAAAKIHADDGAIWHRMGDAGRIDHEGRLWFSGRIAERVETATGPLFTEPVEQVFRGHPQVVRCALIGLGQRGGQEPALVVQTVVDMTTDDETLAAALRELAKQQPHTMEIRKFFFRPDFPLDVRHNAKIHRLTLTEWATTAAVYEPESAP